MNDSIKETRAKLEQILERLPPAWPQKLVFAHLPTLQSPEYLSPVNFLRPNEGFYCLDEGHPANRSFLEFQNWLASTIEMYQIIDTVDAKTLMDELYHTALGLDSLKREHWNRSRLSLAIDTDRPHLLQQLSSPVAMILFTPLLLQTKGLSRRIILFILQFLCLIASMLLNLGPIEQKQVSEELSKVPQSLDRIYEALELDLPYNEYICCPRCFALYNATTLSPIVRPFDRAERGILPNTGDRLSNELAEYLKRPLDSTANSASAYWPAAELLRCTHRPTVNDDMCGARLTVSDDALTKSWKEFDELYEHMSQRVIKERISPNLMFYVANLHHWLADLVSRPGMIDILRKVPELHSRVYDIMESAAIHQLKGSDGHPFIGQHVSGTHICFAMFIDFFNSEGNFIGGKHNSTGGIYLVILNLPMHLRYLPENMFPIFTPGGREPTTEELNHLLRPVINQLIELYSSGISIHRKGLRQQLWTIVHAMLAIIIADTPAAKKIGGFASHAHHWFCHMCRLGRVDIESNLLPTSWPRISYNDYNAIVKAWRDAPSSSIQDELFGIHGLRFSELHRLPYIKMTEWVGAEPMHAIMQNTIQHHIRRTFGINKAQGNHFFDEDEDEDGEAESEPADEIFLDTGITNMDPPELQRGMEIFSRPGVNVRSLIMLANMKVGTLVTLCERAGVATRHLHLHNKQPKRVDMVEALALKMKELRCQTGFIRINVQDAVDALLSNQDHLFKQNILWDLPSDALFELCSLAGIDTSSLPLQRRSIYPTSEAMIKCLLDSPMDFTRLEDINDVITKWKSQTKSSINPKDSTSQPNSTATTNLPHFNSNFLREIWLDIQRTEFPGELENDRPPKYLGSKQHGRLKASQWRTTCCFTMLITLGREWGKGTATANDRMWLSSYLHLVALVRIAYSHSIDSEDIKAFRLHSTKYLEELRSYHPSSIKPCHHFLLHIPEMMERYGPIRGWWAFPFERFNGQIQHLSTNHKIGQVEKRFLTQWHHSAQIRALLASQKVATLSPLVKLANEALEFGVSSPNILDTNAPQLTFMSGGHGISKETRAVLVAGNINAVSHDIKTLSKVILQHSEFEPYKYSRKNGFVEFPVRNASGFWSVGYIHELLQVFDNSKKIHIVACIAQCVDVNEQFLGNPRELGARLCGRKTGQYVMIPVDKLSHVVRYPWSASAQLVISVYNNLFSL